MVAQKRTVKLTLYFNYCSRPKPERATVNSKEQNNIMLRGNNKSVVEMILSSVFSVR